MRRYTYLIAVFVIGLFVVVTMQGGSSAKTKVFQQGTPEELQLARSISLNYLENKIGDYGIKSINNLQVNRVAVDDLSMAHTRVQQTLDGVPVFGGEAIVHLKSDGSFSTLTDNLVSNIAVNTRPDYSKEEATNIALGLYGCSDCLTSAPEVDLWVLRHKNKDHLVYRVQLRREDGSQETAMPVYFIDAHTGKKVWNYDNLQTATGVSLYSGTVSIDTSGSGTSFFMEDLVRKMGTYNYNNGTTTAARFADTDNVWNSAVQQAGVEAHYGARFVYDYYKNVHGRTGIDGVGGPLTTSGGSPSLIGSRVHYSSRYNNAFWNGTYMTYGDGDGSTFTPLVTTDITGHEMTHGVTQYTANLTYSGESGGLNESMSDIFGAMVERYSRGGVVDSNTWKVGEQCYTPSNGTVDALRYMDDPTKDNYSVDNYKNYPQQTEVHGSSGISNNAFYLLSQGGTNRTSGIQVTGIGANSAEKIWYRGLTTYMVASTNFAGARTAMTNAATDLFGASSAQVTAVQTAFCACGVGTCPGGPPPPPPGGGGELLVNGGFEGSLTPWVSSGTGFSYTANNTYPHSGGGYAILGINNSSTGQVYQQVTIPSTATGTLTFWLNVTSSETTTITQYDKLFVEVRNTAGTLLTTLATYSNLNKGTIGVYSQKSFSSALAAYKGQTVRVQFRSTMDSSITTSFRVDDVSVK